MTLSAKVVDTALAIMVGNECRILGLYDVYKGPANFNTALTSGPQFPIHDSLYLVLVLDMVAVTSNPGFGITASTVYDLHELRGTL